MSNTKKARTAKRKRGYSPFGTGMKVVKEKKRIREQSKEYLGNSCEICGTPDNLTIHHIIPISRGGGANQDNCCTLCRNCHDGVELMILRKRKAKRGTQKERDESIKSIDEKLTVILDKSRKSNENSTCSYM